MATLERDRRFNARLSEQEEGLLREAAAQIGKPVSRFVVDAGVQEARAILAESRAFRVADEASAAFEAWLDEPARDLPAARDLAAVEPFERA